MKRDDLRYVESAFLGGVMVFGPNLPDHVFDLPRSALYFESHRILWDVFKSLHERGEYPSIPTVVLEASRLDVNLEPAGSDRVVVWLAQLCRDSAFSSVEVETLYDRFVQAHHRKSIVRALENYASDVSSGRDPNLDQMVDRIRDLVLSAPRRSVDSQPIGQILATLEQHQERADQLGGTLGPGFGITDLDDHLYGFAPGELTVLCGRPGHGKTALAVKATHNVLSQGGRVAYFVFESFAHELMARLLTIGAGVPFAHVWRNRFDESTLATYHDFLPTARNWDLHLWGQGDCTRTPAGVRQRVASLCADGFTPDLVVVDHAHCMVLSEGGNEISSDRVQELNNLAWAMKTQAGDMKVPYLLLAQANRSVDRKVDVQMNDVKGTGGFEEHAHCLMFCRRKAEEGLAWIDLRKLRNAQSDVRIDLSYLGERMEWDNRLRGDQPAAPPGEGGAAVAFQMEVPY